MAEVGPRQREIVELIIGNLNPDGFLVATLEEILGDGRRRGARVHPGGDRGGAAPSCAPSIRRASPASTCARACCCRWTSRGSRRTSLARRMVDEAWDLFLRRQFPAVAKKLSVDLPELEAALEIIKHARDPPGPPVQHRPAALHRARRLRPPGRRRVRHPAQRRRPAAAAGQPRLPAHAADHAQRGAAERGADVHQGQDPLGGLADQEPRPAPAHDLQGRRVDRPPAARVPRPRHRAPAADGAARRRRGHRHARVDGQPRGLQQVHPHPARPVPDEVLLPQRHRPRVRRQHLLADGEAQDRAARSRPRTPSARSPTAS